MLLAGIIGEKGKGKTANLVYSIFTSTGKKVSIIDSERLGELDSKRFKSYINELGKNNVDILIFKIDFNDIYKTIFDNITFDVMICQEYADDLMRDKNIDYRRLMHRMFELLDEKGIAIVNLDDSEFVELLKGIKKCIVTYGFSSKANITTSSVGDIMFKDDFICFLQNTISTKKGHCIEPQEFRLRLETSENNTYSVLAAATFAIINGVDLNTIKS